jgi:hypothetical protein
MGGAELVTNEVKVQDRHDVFEAVCRLIPRRESNPDSTDRWIVDFYRIADGHHLGPQRWLNRMATEDELVQILDHWIYEKAGSQSPPKVYCRSCKAELIPDAKSDTDYQFDNALWIRFDGGYGMFIDPFDEAPPKAVICHECAHKLCDENPWLKDLLNPHGSHSHKSAYVDANPSHYGWDYDHRAESEE